MYQFDLIIIGSGPGGYVSAIRASQLGLKVAIIEKDKIGGVCLNIGCIPSKNLIHQAEIFNQIDTLKEMGLKIDFKKFDYKKIFKKSREAAEKLSKGVNFLLKKNKIEYLFGEAKITSANEIIVKNKSYTTKYILIASGSRPKELKEFAIDEKKILSSTGILMLEKLPKSLLILGAGAIGVEFAYIMNSFGVKVHLVEAMNQILPLEDEEIAKFLYKIYKKNNINVLIKSKALFMQKISEKIFVHLEINGIQKSLEVESILSAVGRNPNSENIGLEKCGIITDNNFIKVNEYYQTNIDNIYAVGDVINSPLLAHIASKEGEIAVEHIAGIKPKILDYNTSPSTIYCEPQIASFGPSEKKLKKNKINYKKFLFPYTGSGKSIAINNTEGFVKILVDENTHEIYSAHIIGYQATELIHELLLAKSAELLPEDISKMIHAHPTLSENIMEAMRGIENWAIHI